MKRTLAIVLSSIIILQSLAIPGRGQDRPPFGCDTSAIKWVLPGDFGKAVQRAKKENRLIVIKGVSFGIDVAGAKCATKGKW